MRREGVRKEDSRGGGCEEGGHFWFIITSVISGRAYIFEFKHSRAIRNNSMKESDGQLPACPSILVHKIDPTSLSMSCSI